MIRYFGGFGKRGWGSGSMDNDIKSLKKLVVKSGLPPNVSVEKRPIRRWGINAALLIIGVLMILYGYQNLYTYEYYKAWREEFTILPKDAQPWYWHFEKEGILEINATVRGGDGDIIIYIVDENGRRVKDFGKLVSPIRIRFLAPSPGNYTVYFDNTFSTLVPKKIYATASLYVKELQFWALEWILVGVVLIIICFLNVVLGNTKVLVLRIGEDTYEFEPWWGSLKIRVNGMEVKERVVKKATFRIGPNDEHILDIKRKFSITWTWKWEFMLDGKKIGEVP
uniref:emp24/gp25L/p24 family protein n=1 Tax=Pyrococcus abyssi TaxID=29292 RepID=UPI001C0A70A2|nr:emp24/gp25L/p24 family protein [Pyrococcus abyssi]